MTPTPAAAGASQQAAAAAAGTRSQQALAPAVGTSQAAAAPSTVAATAAGAAGPSGAAGGESTAKSKRSRSAEEAGLGKERLGSSSRAWHGMVGQLHCENVWAPVVGDLIKLCSLYVQDCHTGNQHHLHSVLQAVLTYASAHDIL
jgi:hypothetical protein